MAFSRLHAMFFATALALASAASITQGEEALVAANPIRKVVSMLQGMEKKVIQEGEKHKTLFDKFMCYCSTGSGELSSSISAAEGKLDTLPTTVTETEDKLKAVKEDLKRAKTDRASAKDAVASANGIREKEAAAFGSTKTEYDANIAAIKKAVAALESGMGGSFLQSGAAQTLRHLVADKQDLQDDDRYQLSAFLSKSNNGYAPQSGAITGILKQMDDEMSKALAEATAAENAAIKDHAAMVSAKTKEIDALTKAVEKKTKQAGDLGVEIVQLKDDLDDTSKALLADKAFLKDLDKTCATKKAEYAADSKTRAAELTALAETIKVLNEDDALELFKKTLPGSSSFIEMKSTSASMQTRAMSVINKVRASVSGPQRAHLDLIALMLHGKKVDFAKVIKMIDDMTKLLKQEQNDDDGKKDYCTSSFDDADDKKKALEKAGKDAQAAIEKAENAIDQLSDELAELEAGVNKLDKDVVEATNQRQAENAAYKELVAQDTATKELLKFAKNRLNKFYNPKLYKAAPKTELSSEGRIVESFSLAQISQHQEHRADPGPAPDAGSYSKSTQEATGVISMLDLLIGDMDKELTEAGAEEKDAQADYEEMIADSKSKRTADTKSIDEKTKIRADMEAELESQTSVKKDTNAELYATLKYIDSLHGECDFLLQYYDTRKAARSSEITSLQDAKAVLSGADYSLVQASKRTFLSRSQ